MSLIVVFLSIAAPRGLDKLLALFARTGSVQKERPRLPRSRSRTQHKLWDLRVQRGIRGYKTPVKKSQRGGMIDPERHSALAFAPEKRVTMAGRRRTRVSQEEGAKQISARRLSSHGASLSQGRGTEAQSNVSRSTPSQKSATTFSEALFRPCGLSVAPQRPRRWDAAPTGSP
jgi:hypothetical protein